MRRTTAALAFPALLTSGCAATDSGRGGASARAPAPPTAAAWVHPLAWTAQQVASGLSASCYGDVAPGAAILVVAIGCYLPGGAAAAGAGWHSRRVA